MFICKEVKEEKAGLLSSKRSSVICRECSFTESSLLIGGKPQYSVEFSELRVHDLASEGLPLSMRISQGSCELVTLSTEDATSKVEFLKALEAGLRAHAPEELQMERFWVHRTLLTGTLHWASVEGNVEAAKSIIALSLFDVDALDGDGCTPFLVACATGHDDVAETLLTSGTSVSITDGEGCTPLHLAIASGHTNCANLCVVNSAPLDAVDLLGRTPFSLLLASSAELATSPPLRALVLLMLSYGASPDDTDCEGFTPLHRAALAPAVGEEGVVVDCVVEALGKHGGDPGKVALTQRPGEVGDDSLNALHIACGARFDGEDISRGAPAFELGDTEEGEGEGGADDVGPLPTSIYPISIPTINSLLSWGSPPNAPCGYTGETPLHLLLRSYLALTTRALSSPPHPNTVRLTSLAAQYASAAGRVAAAGGRFSRDVVDAGGKSVDSLVRACGLKVRRVLEEGAHTWALRKAPQRTVSMTFETAGSGSSKGGNSLVNTKNLVESKLASFGAGVKGFFTSLGAKRGTGTDATGNTKTQGGGASGSGGGGDDLGAARVPSTSIKKLQSCPICPSPITQTTHTVHCGLCLNRVCSACATSVASSGPGLVRRAAGGGSEADSDDDNDDNSSGSNSSTPKLPGTPSSPTLNLCDPCCSKSLAREASDSAAKAQWAVEKSKALAQARNFAAEEEGGGGEQGKKQLHLSLAAKTRGLASSAAAATTSPGGEGVLESTKGSKSANLFGEKNNSISSSSRSDRKGAGALSEDEKAQPKGKVGAFMSNTFGSLSALMAGNKEKLMERGEKLSRTEEASADLAKDAQEFGSLAEKLKKKAQGGWGGLF